MELGLRDHDDAVTYLSISSAFVCNNTHDVDASLNPGSLLLL